MLVYIISIHLYTYVSFSEMLRNNNNLTRLNFLNISDFKWSDFSLNILLKENIKSFNTI